MSSTYAIVAPALRTLVRKGVVSQANRQAAYHRLAQIVAADKPADWKALLWLVKARMDRRAEGKLNAARVEQRLAEATASASPAETARARKNRLAREKRAAARQAKLAAA